MADLRPTTASRRWSCRYLTALGFTRQPMIMTGVDHANQLIAAMAGLDPAIRNSRLRRLCPANLDGRLEAGHDGGRWSSS